jgi:hypothetical protein
MGIKYWTAAAESVPTSGLPAFRFPPAADRHELIILDASALTWLLPLEISRVRVEQRGLGASTSGAPARFVRDASVDADVRADVGRLVTLGEPRAVCFAAARLVAYLQVHGLTPLAVFDRAGHWEAEGLKSANAAAGPGGRERKRPQNGRHVLERLLAGAAMVGHSDRRPAPDNGYVLSHHEPRLAGAESAVIEALAAAGCQVVASQGEADLVVERLSRRFDQLAVLSDDTDALCVKPRGGWAALHIVRSNYVPWRELLTTATGSHTAVAAAVARTRPLPYLSPVHFARHVATVHAPRFVPELLQELALVCGTDYTKDLPGQMAWRKAAVPSQMENGERAVTPLARFVVSARFAVRELLREPAGAPNGAGASVTPLEDWLSGRGYTLDAGLLSGMRYSRRRFAGAVAPLEEDVGVEEDEKEEGSATPTAGAGGAAVGRLSLSRRTAGW